MKCRSGDKPDENDKNGAAKRPRAAKQYGGTVRKTPERVADGAKKITLLLISLRYFCPGMIRHVT